MLLRNSLIYTFAILLILVMLMGMKQLTAQQRVEHQYHAVALEQAKLMVADMQANANSAKQGHYDNSMPLRALPICKPCKGQDQAKVDIMNWQLANKLHLPEGQGKIIYDDQQYKVTVSWKTPVQDTGHCDLKGFNCVTILYQP